MRYTATISGGSGKISFPCVTRREAKMLVDLTGRADKIRLTMEREHDNLLKQQDGDIDTLLSCLEMLAGKTEWHGGGAFVPYAWTQRLNKMDEEQRGRLLYGALVYAASGSEPDLFTDAERCVWKSMRAELDEIDQKEGAPKHEDDPMKDLFKDAPAYQAVREERKRENK